MWVDLVSENVQRLRAYAGMALGSQERGDAAVHAALAKILTLHVSQTPDRLLLFGLVDREIVRASRKQVPFFPKASPLGALTPLERRAVLLRVTHGFTEEEAGEILSLPAKDVKTVLDAAGLKNARLARQLRPPRPARRRGSSGE
ncbi:MAG: hypothetical protein KDA53_17605 [Hyphomonas sp.]|nr:hypothetical protein [Hyphomonas sp.]